MTSPQEARKSFGVAAVLGFIALGLALLSLVVFNGMVSTALFLLAALMGYSRGFREHEAKGKRTMNPLQRVIVGTVLTVTGFVFLPVTPKAPAPSTPPTPTQQAVSDKVSEAPKALDPAEVKDKIARLLDAERQLDRQDYEGRLFVWDDVVALDRDNRDYARRRAEVKASVDELAPYRENPELGGEIVSFRPRKEGFGVVMVANISIRNRALSHLKDFVIVCDNKGPSGTTISRSKHTLFEMVPSRSTRAFRDVNLGVINPQTKSTNCQIERASIA